MIEYPYTDAICELFDAVVLHEPPGKGETSGRYWVGLPEEAGTGSPEWRVTRDTKSRLSLELLVKRIANAGLVVLHPDKTNAPAGA